VRGLVDAPLLSFAVVGFSYTLVVLIAFPEYLSVALIATKVYNAYRASRVEMLDHVRTLGIEIALIWSLYETSPFGTRMRIFGRMISVAALVFLAEILMGFLVIEFLPDVVLSRTGFTRACMAIFVEVVICSHRMVRQLEHLPSRHQLITSEFARGREPRARGEQLRAQH